MKNTSENPIAIELRRALGVFESIKTELVAKGLAQRKSYGFEMNDTRHPRYAAYRQADAAYWAALANAENAGLIKVHNSSFSWLV